MPEAQMLKTCKQNSNKKGILSNPLIHYHRRDIVVIVVNS